jgi:hypothetical protein
MREKESQNFEVVRLDKLERTFLQIGYLEQVQVLSNESIHFRSKGGETDFITKRLTRHITRSRQVNLGDSR